MQSRPSAPDKALPQSHFGQVTGRLPPTSASWVHSNEHTRVHSRERQGQQIKRDERILRDAIKAKNTNVVNAYLTHFAISPDKLSETDTYGVAIAQIQAEKVKVITRYILIFLAIVAFLLLLFTRIPGPAANKLNSAGAWVATSDAAPGSSESIVRDFTTGPFKKDFYDDIRQTAKAKAETAGNLNIEKLVVIHFIRDEFQIAFQAYKGISLMRRDTDGVLPLYVSTTFGGPSLTVDYFDLGYNEARPTIRSRPTVQPNRRPIVTVNAN